MSVSIENLSSKELSELISRANQRKKVLAKRKPANQVKAAVAKFLTSVGWTFDELYGRTGGGKPAGIVVALDRQEVLGEPGASGPRRSAAQSVAVETGVPVVAVANLHDLLAFAGESAELVSHRDRLLAYRASYGSGPTD